MGSMAKPIEDSLRFTDFIMDLVTGDMKNEDAVKRARGDEGASISWVVGHLIHYRYLIMNLLGAEKENPFAEKFGNAGASDGSDYPDISELRRSWKEASEEAIGVVAAATDEQLTNPLGGPDSRMERRPPSTRSSSICGMSRIIWGSAARSEPTWATSRPPRWRLRRLSRSRPAAARSPEPPRRAPRSDSRSHAPARPAALRPRQETRTSGFARGSAG